MAQWLRSRSQSRSLSHGQRVLRHLSWQHLIIERKPWRWNPPVVLCVLCVVDSFSAIGGPRWRYITANISQASTLVQWLTHPSWLIPDSERPGPWYHWLYAFYAFYAWWVYFPTVRLRGPEPSKNPTGGGQTHEYPVTMTVTVLLWRMNVPVLWAQQTINSGTEAAFQCFITVVCDIYKKWTSVFTSGFQVRQAPAGLLRPRRYVTLVAHHIENHL